MAYYKFIFKKGDSILEAETQDTDLLSRQFEKSVADAFGLTAENYRKQSPFRRATNFDYEKRSFQQSMQLRKPTSLVNVTEKKKVTDDVSKEFESFLQKGNHQVEKSESAQQKLDVFEQPEVKLPDSANETPEVLDNNVVSDSDSSFKEISPETETFEQSVDDKEKTALEQDVDTSNADLSIDNDEEQDTPQEILPEVVESATEVTSKEDPVTENTGDFYKVLQNKFASIPDEITSQEPKSSAASLEDVKTIDDLFKIKSPVTMLDYLVTSAYFLKFYENLDRYTLKQLNLKVLPVTKVPVNHAVIQEAVAANYIEVVPDYTGSAYVTEYTITDEGARYVLNEL